MTKDSQVRRGSVQERPGRSTLLSALGLLVGVLLLVSGCASGEAEAEGAITALSLIHI